jgi:ribose-phosphate pyrophosphokinase
VIVQDVLPRRAVIPPVHMVGDDRLKLFSGSANPDLATQVARYLGLSPGPMVRKTFADGEIYVQIQESIRGCDVYLIQPTCRPVNDNLMELMILIDACKRASARQITAVLPYYGYARADRKTAGRESIAAKLVANLITKAGVSRVLAMDLHSAQIQGYFDIPLDHVYGSPVLLQYIKEKQLDDVVIVSPDVGGVARARSFAKKLGENVPLAFIDKRRPEHNMVEVMNVIGDVQDKTAILVDDIIDTAGTIAQSGKVLLECGAKEVYACATHAVFSPQSLERLSDGTFAEVIVTNTIPIPPEKQFPQLRVLSVADLIGEAIWRIHEDSSVSSMFR